MVSNLVFIAALVQFVPVGLASSRLISDAASNALVSESLSADTHSVDHWATQPTALTRLSGEKSSEVEPLSGGLATFLSTVVDPDFLHHWKTHCDHGGYHHRFVTLVNLNVRLQV